MESEEVKNQVYIDDLLTAATGKEEALVKTSRWDEICSHASMPNKGWTYSGDDASDVDIGCDMDVNKVLGLGWDPKTDTFLFRVVLKAKLHTGASEVIKITSVEEEEKEEDNWNADNLLTSLTSERGSDMSH